MQEISEKLLAAAQDVRLKQKLEADLQTVRAELAQENNRYNKLQKKLQKEGQDVQRLEGLSITGLFYTVLGSKEKQLDKERKEYLAATLKCEQCKQILQELKQDEKKLTDKIQPLQGIEKEYQNLLQQKEKMILSAENPQSAQIFALTDDVANLTSAKKELGEAIMAGENVLLKLKAANDSLNSAKNWGTWDMLGGGLLATAVKHSKIDDAKSEISRIQTALERFSRELKDVNTILPDIRLEIGSFATFADYFFDGLIADWIVQSKINDSRDQVIRTKNTVGQILQTLKRKRRDVVQELGKKEQERRNLIEIF